MRMPPRYTTMPPSTTCIMSAADEVAKKACRTPAILARGFVVGEFGFGHLFGGESVVALLLGEVAEQLAHAGVRRAARGGFVEAPCLHFHRFRRLLDRLESERTHQPDRPPFDEAF